MPTIKDFHRSEPQKLELSEITLSTLLASIEKKAKDSSQIFSNEISMDKRFSIRKRKLKDAYAKLRQKQLLHFPERLKQLCKHQDSFIYTIAVELLNNKSVLLTVNLGYTIGSIVSDIREHQASSILNWPHTRRRNSLKSSKGLLSEWSCPAALKISFRNRVLDASNTLRDLAIGPYSRLQAHMYFSDGIQQSKIGSQDAIETNNPLPPDTMKGRGRGVKRSREGDVIDEVKRKKYNEPLRNNHFHNMLNVHQRIEVSAQNAARYGIDVDQLEDILNDLSFSDNGQ